MRKDTINYVGDVASENKRSFDVMRYNGSGAALAAGDVVQTDRAQTTFNTAQHIKKCATATLQEALGGCVAAIADGAWGLVRVSGEQASVGVDTSVAAGDLLVGSGTTAGRLGKQPGTHAAIEHVAARAVTAESANTATVFWMNPQKVES